MGRRKKAYRIAVIDCETDPFDGLTFVKPFIWGFYDGDDYQQFSTAQELVDYVKDEDYLIYAHNGGKFDYHFMLDLLDDFQDLMIINGRLSKFKIGNCEFRDSYNIIPIPLAAWQKDDFDYTILKKEYRDIPENKKKIEKYLRNDCVYLFEMITSFINEYGLHLTQASAAMKLWQEMSNIDAPKSDLSYYEFFAPYYYGGRVECFETGFKKQKFDMIDINSAYPFAMLDKHPFSTSFVEEENLSQKEVRQLLKTKKGKAGFYNVVAVARGCFPYRASDGSLFFPNDEKTRTYYITGWELLAAIETDSVYIEEILIGYTFNTLIDFSTYILHFYKKRKAAKVAGDKSGDIFSKLLMNSLYGKFASRPENYKKYTNIPLNCAGAIGQEMGDKLANVLDNDEKEIKKYDLEEWHYSGDLGPWALAAKGLEEHEQTYYNIATSASITGYVRAFMWRTLCECSGLIYCDTDSIAAKTFSDKIKMSKELGDWDKEGEFLSYSIAGKKMYAFEYAPKYVKQNSKTGEMDTHKIASKGVRFNAQQVKEAALGNIVLFEPEAPSYSIHKEPVFTARNVTKTSRTLQDIEKRDDEKKREVVAKNIKRLKND